MAAGVVFDFTANLTRWTSSLDKATRDLNKFQSNASRIAGQVKGAFGGLAAGLSVGGFAAFIKSSIDAADNLNDLSKKTGVTVENLAGLDLVARSSGTSLDDIGTALGRLSKYMGEAAAGGKEQAAMLKALGVTATDPLEALYQLADAFGRFSTEGDKARALSGPLGKAWQSLAPALSEGGDAMRKLVEQGKQLNPVTQQMAQQADKFNDSLAALTYQAKGAGITLANSLIPAMTGLLEHFNTAVTLSSQHGGFISLILGGVNPTGDVGANLQNVRKEIEAIQIQLKDAGTVEGDVAGIDGKRLRERLAELEKLKATLLQIQQTQALALNDKYGTADYKTAKKPGTDKKIVLPKEGSDKKDKLDEIDPYGKERRAAEAEALRKAVEVQNAAYDDLAAMREYQIEQDEQAAAALGRMREEMLRVIDPIQQYRDKLAEVDVLQEKGRLTAEQATEARFYWQEQIEAAAGFGKKLEEVTDNFTKKLQEEVQSALADFLFDPFSDGLDGMLKKFSQMLQRMVAEAVAADIAKAIFGDSKGGGQNIFGSIASIFGFSTGGIMTPSGPMPLRRYASGGVARGPQMALFGEGSSPEAYVPLPDGRRIPVAMNGGGSAPIVNVTIQATDLGSFQRSEGQISASLARAVNASRRFQ